MNIDQLHAYAIDGCVDVVTFDKCRIQKFSAYALNTHCWSIYRISIENTEIAAIDMHALKKLSIDYVTLRNVTFQSDLPSRAISGLDITKQIAIENCSFKTINTLAIELKGMCAKLNNLFWFANVNDNIRMLLIQDESKIVSSNKKYIYF